MTITYRAGGFGFGLGFFGGVGGVCVCFLKTAMHRIYKVK